VIEMMRQSVRRDVFLHFFEQFCPVFIIIMMIRSRVDKEHLETCGSPMTDTTAMAWTFSNSYSSFCLLSLGPEP
jgi:hypothetical protein